MVKIKIISAIEAEVGKQDLGLFSSCLEFPSVYWKQGQFRKERISYNKKLYTNHRGNYRFLTGFLPKIIKHLKNKGIEAKIDTSGLIRLKSQSPELEGITFRDDQLWLIKQARKSQRGVILSPTGTGKTIIQLGIMSSFPSCRILLLVHTISIVTQTIEELRKFGFPDVQQLGGGEKGVPTSKIVVSTIQTFSKLDLLRYCDYFDMVIVDEAHRVSSFSGGYHTVLNSLLAPIRLGFTATFPENAEARMAIEGLLGPVIGKLTINKAAELNILAKPKIKLIKSAYSHTVHDLRRYAEVYDAGIVHNRHRNTQIVDKIAELKKSDTTVLVFVAQIEHGEIIRRMCRESGLDIQFVQGATSSEERERIKGGLESGEIHSAISTTVWKEGVNIPNLGAIINACGGKSEVAVLQSIGRGLRKTGEKEEVFIYDFFDPSHRFLIDHFGHRISLYMDSGWL